MKIQLISENHKSLLSYKNTIDLSDLSNPKSLSNYDVNIVDLNNKQMWLNCFNTGDRVTNDLKNIGNMIEKSKSLVVIIFPQNIVVGSSNTEAKNYLSNIKNKIFQIINVNLFYSPFYENSSVDLLGDKCMATFAFESQDVEEILFTETKKTVAIKKDNIIITTVDIINNFKTDLLEKFLEATNCFGNIEEIPEWVYKYEFFNDKNLNENINNSKEIIKVEKDKIKKYQEQLNNNLDCKKILCCNGEELVKQTFKIIENIFDISLSDFEDVKREDFLFKKNEITYIGEIKGVTSNVKFEHVSQLNIHVSKYRDELQDTDKEEIIIPLLIINYERNREISERNEIHQEQIDLAKKLDIVIIDTVTLLRLYSDILEEKITKNYVIEKIMSTKGIFKY